MSDQKNSGLQVTQHAMRRLRERFPGREAEILAQLNAFCQRHEDFIRDTAFRYRRGNLVAVIKRQCLITAFPRKDHGQPA